MCNDGPAKASGDDRRLRRPGRRATVTLKPLFHIPDLATSMRAFPMLIVRFQPLSARRWASARSLTCIRSRTHGEPSAVSVVVARYGQFASDAECGVNGQGAASEFLAGIASPNLAARVRASCVEVFSGTPNKPTRRRCGREALLDAPVPCTDVA